MIRTILQPCQTLDLAGEPIELGESTTNNIALVSRELAINAAKYGALSFEEAELISAIPSMTAISICIGGSETARVLPCPH